MKEKYFAKPSFNQSTLCVKLEIWAKSKLLLFLVFLECIGFFGFFWPIVFLLECIGVSVGAWRPLLLRSPPVASWTSGPGRAGLLPVLCRAPPGAPSSRATCTKAAPYSLFWCWCTKSCTKSCTKLSTTWCTKQIIVLLAPKLLWCWWCFWCYRCNKSCNLHQELLIHIWCCCEIGGGWR